jgi:hypothetical protein
VNGKSGNILIQSLPPLFTFLFIATLAASICLLVIFADSSAFNPNSPNATVAPLWATPVIRPLITFLCFTLFGINIKIHLSVYL